MFENPSDFVLMFNSIDETLKKKQLLKQWIEISVCAPNNPEVIYETNIYFESFEEIIQESD